MASPAPKLLGIDRSHDGARVLVRHFLSTVPPVERWVREFDAEGKHVRLSKTNSVTDAGTWARIYDLVLVGVLEPGKAPAAAEPPDVTKFIDFPGGAE